MYGKLIIPGVAISLKSYPSRVLSPLSTEKTEKSDLPTKNS